VGFAPKHPEPPTNYFAPRTAKPKDKAKSILIIKKIA
jgi:hypothetical protein